MQDASKNIFVSYTTIDKEINLELLIKIEGIFSKYGNVYIDLLHNNSEKPQEKVIFELEKTDCLVVIDTKNVENSKWVNIEIEKSAKRNIEILKLSISDILEEKFSL